MDKARRHELKMLKYKKRINQLGLNNPDGNFYAYRSHGKPCSCFMCSPYKYERKGLQRVSSEEIQAIRIPSYKLLLP